MPAPAKPSADRRRWPLVLFGILVLLKLADLLDSLGEADGPGEMTLAIVIFVVPIAFIGYVVLRYRRHDRERAAAARNTRPNS